MILFYLRVPLSTNKQKKKQLVKSENWSSNESDAYVNKR